MFFYLYGHITCNNSKRNSMKRFNLQKEMLIISFSMKIDIYSKNAINVIDSSTIPVSKCDIDFCISTWLGKILNNKVQPCHNTLKHLEKGIRTTNLCFENI